MIELYNGDCLALMDKIPNHSVDMILCDLPYGATKTNGTLLFLLIIYGNGIVYWN